MKVCVKQYCFMAGQCSHYDEFLKATRTDENVPVEFVDMYKPDGEGKCLNFDFKADKEIVADVGGEG